MPYDPTIHHRRSIRLKGYDYTQPGAYFVTMVTHRRAEVFGEVVNGVMRLSPLGEIARTEWLKTAQLRPYVRLFEDEFVVMPNHVHGIIWMIGNGEAETEVRARRRRALTPDGAVECFGKPVSGSIPTIIRAYKSAVTYAANGLKNQRGAVLWQRNYYEHIIRNQAAFERIWEYIDNNPRKWEADQLQPSAPRNKFNQD